MASSSDNSALPSAWAPERLPDLLPRCTNGAGRLHPVAAQPVQFGFAASQFTQGIQRIGRERSSDTHFHVRQVT
jgi:hypothetical protein